MKWLCLLLLPFVAFAQNELLNIRVLQENEKVRYVFDFKKKFDYQIFNLENPDRLVIDLKNTKSVQDFTNINTGKYKIRKDIRNRNDLRVVLDLDKSLDNRHFILKPSDPYPYHRLVLDIYKPKKINLPRYSRNVVIVLDPGHGGLDPGAIGPNKTQEKHVVLKIAKKIATELCKHKGVQVVFTRADDSFIPLRQRLNIAREHNADLFISIHADAFKYPSARGSSVFALSEKGATSEAARWLSVTGNYSELGGVDFTEIADESGIIRSVLLDLSQSATIGASLQIGTKVLDELGKVNRLHKNTVEQARFVVLRSPDIPSILIETGFISNPEEEKNLNFKAHRKKLAKAISNGVIQYLNLYAPYDTYIAQNN